MVPYKTHGQACARRPADRPHPVPAAATPPFALGARLRTRSPRLRAPGLPSAPPAPRLPARLSCAPSTAAPSRFVDLVAGQLVQLHPNLDPKLSSVAPRSVQISKRVAWSMRGTTSGSVSRRKAGAMRAWAAFATRTSRRAWKAPPDCVRVPRLPHEEVPACSP